VLDAGGTVRVPAGSLNGRPASVAVGFRPEKVRLGPSGAPASDGDNTLEGTVTDQSYVGVSTQYIVETPAGPIAVYLQNAEPGVRALARGDRVTLAWSPEATFVVENPDHREEQFA
jgi:spermidine/putrescine transport system ATP-binding protein